MKRGGRARTLRAEPNAARHTHDPHAISHSPGLVHVLDGVGELVAVHHVLRGVLVRTEPAARARHPAQEVLLAIVEAPAIVGHHAELVHHPSAGPVPLRHAAVSVELQKVGAIQNGQQRPRRCGRILGVVDAGGDVPEDVSFCVAPVGAAGALEAKFGQEKEESV